MRENRVIKIGDDQSDLLNNFLWYTSDTAPGSSGCPRLTITGRSLRFIIRVFLKKKDNGVTKYRLISGDWVTEDVFNNTPDEKRKYIANEGIRISRIIADITHQQTAAGAAGASRLIQTFLDDLNGVETFPGTQPNVSVNGPAIRFDKFICVFSSYTWNSR